MEQKEKTFIILSIEDNEADFHLLKKAFFSIPDIKINIINEKDGEKALKYIYNCKNNIPDLIVLDLNLPTMSGIEFLKIIKKEDKYKAIPIIIFSTSDSKEDIQESYRFYANSYITKTFEIKDFFSKISSLGEFWLKTAKLPDNNIYFIKNISKEK